MENIDETHFVINMDNGQTLGFRGDKVVKYVDMVAGGLGITMVMKVTRGVSGKIGMSFLIFQNTSCSYPIPLFVACLTMFLVIATIQQKKVS